METFAAFTPAVTPTPTPYPWSDAMVTIAISASATELQVGDIVTFTVVVTNTGKLRLDKIGCTPEIYFEDGIDQRFTKRPNILEASIPPAGHFDFDMYVLPVGYSAVTSFTLRALNPGTATVKAGVSALTRFSHTRLETWWGISSTGMLIHVHSSFLQ